MAIEVRGPSGWNPYYDPEIYTEYGWNNINFGFIYTGNGPVSGWSYIYARVTPVAPTITLNSRTTTSITVNVTHPNVDSDRVRVYIYRVGNEAGGQYKPSSTPTTSPINSTFQQTGLTMNTTYTFRAYAEYLDENSNLIATSTTTEVQFTTINIVTQAPTLSLDSRTSSQITLDVTHPGASGLYRVRVFVYRVGNELGGQYKPNSSGTTGSIASTFTESGLAQGTSYTFRAYAEYLDLSDSSVLATSSTTTFVQATSTYSLWTPAAPTGTTGYEKIGSTYYGTMTLTASANPQYSINGSTSRIRFEITDFTNTYTADSLALSNSDSLQSRSVTFSYNNNTNNNGLGLGFTYICRARVIYPTIGEVGPWSDYSTITTPDWTRKYAPSSTAHINMSNTTFFSSFYSAADSVKSASESHEEASDNSSSTQWLSDPYTYQNQTTTETRSINGFSSFSGIHAYDTTSSHNITSGSTGTVTMNSITMYGVGKTYVDASFIVIELSGSQPAPGGTTTIFGSGISGVDGVARSIQNTSVSSGIRSVRFLRGSVAANQIGSAGRLVMGSSATFGGVSIPGLGGTSALTVVDSDTFTRNDTSIGAATTEQCVGSVAYPVTSLVQVPKSSGTENLILWASPNLSGDYRNVQLESIQYQQGTIATGYRSISVNSSFVAGGAAGANLVSTISTSAFAPNRTQFGLPGGTGWYLAIAVDRGQAGSLWYSSVKEVGLRYSYEVIE